MNLKNIQDMWKEDSVIDDIELDASSLQVPRLHAKYTEILSNKKLELIRHERMMKELNKDKHQLLSILNLSNHPIDLQKKSYAI